MEIFNLFFKINYILNPEITFSREYLRDKMLVR
jgi:hypothetical protein